MHEFIFEQKGEIFGELAALMLNTDRSLTAQAKKQTLLCQSGHMLGRMLDRMFDRIFIRSNVLCRLEADHLEAAFSEVYCGVDWR